MATDGGGGDADPSRAPPPPTPRLPWRDDPRATAVIVASALFMQNLDGTAVATALPAMAADLGETPLHLSAAITAYLVSLTVLVPVSGWVADRFGAKRVFLLAILVFVAASAACGLATGLGELVAARAVQGAGAALMVPVARLLLLRRVTKEELVRATTWLTMPGLLGPILGPPVAGFLTDALSWRAVFLINLPVGALGLLMAWRFVPDPPRVADPPPLDARGVALVGGSLAALVLALETVGRGLVPAWATLAGFGAGVAVGLAALRHLRRAADPAVDLTLLREPAFAASCVAGTLFRVGAGATPFLVPLSLQLGFGVSATVSGLVSLATALGAIASKPVVGALLRAFGFRGVLVWNGLAAAGGIAALALVGPSWPLWAVFVLLALGGVFRSVQFTALNTLAYAELPAERLSAATSLYATIQQLSLALGVVVGSGALAAAAAVTGGGPGGTPGAGDFPAAFLIAALPVLLAMPLAARLPPEAGAQVSGHRGGPARR